MIQRALPLLLTRIATAAVVALTAGAAQAGSWAKSEAILGGQPSALAAILAQQNARSGPDRPLAAPAELRPASYSTPPVVQAIARQPAATSPAVTSGRPDLFGSVALRVGATRLNARWARVENARVGGTAANYARSLAELDRVDQLEAINRYVNRRVRFVDDSVQYGRADVWAAAADTLSRGRGDCEDYAIAKFQMLRRAGFADKDMYMVIVKDLVTRGDHAVLVVRAGDRMYVLDNGTERLIESESVRDYRPVLTFAASGTWTHGYRVKAASVEMASADQPGSPFGDRAPQRSWSASPLAFSTGFSR